MTGPINPVDNRTEGRDAMGRFGAGNPGRPRGSKNQVSRTALAAVQNLSNLAILKLRERIEGGDMAAIRLTLEYTLPRAGRTIDLETTDPLAVADALAMGDITPDEADKIASAYGKLQSIHEIEDLRKRVDEMETAIAERRR